MTEEQKSVHFLTMQHIQNVSRRLTDAATELLNRSKVHDNSKLEPPEMELFAEATPRLAKLTYGSEEYKESLRSIKPAVDHHNAVNSHHPEHYSNGIDGMTIFDLTEMLCDWCAAVERHEDGDVWKSIEHNRTRFGMSDQLVNVFTNTLRGMGYSESKRR